MKVTFQEEGHRYESNPAVSWTSVTKVVEMFTPEFDDEKQAVMSSQTPNGKWYGISAKKILKLWENERNRSTEVGSWWHHKMEQKAIKIGKKEHRGQILQVFETGFIDGVKTARDQVLHDGVFPEHLIYNENIGICGQSDLVFKAGEYVDISDYKTNKKMDLHSYGWDRGYGKYMLGPLSHLEDCNYNHYALQLSIYMKLILIKNKALKAGDLNLIHVIFELEKYDKYGFPVIAKDKNGYIVKEIKKYPVPYLEKEAETVLRIMYKNFKGM